MIDLLSTRIADFLCKRNVINSEEKELYVYGYQLLISSFIGILLTIILGFLFGHGLLAIAFLIIFIPTRQHCGGFHANHFTTCIFSFLSVYLVIMLLTEFMIKSDYILCTILMELFYFLTVVRFAPIEHKNKPLSEEVKKDNYQKSIIYSVVWIMITIPCYFFLPELAILIALTLAAIAVLMLLEIMKKEVKPNET